MIATAPVGSVADQCRIQKHLDFSAHIGNSLRSVNALLAMVCALGFLSGAGIAVGEDEVATENPYKAENLSALYLKFERQDLVDLFQPGEFVADNGQAGGPSLLYRLFVPSNLEEGKRYPLIVWVHGFGDTETTELNLNTGQLKHTQLIFTDTKTPETYPFYVLAPQNRESANWFDEGASSPGEMALELIDETIEHHPIDASRVVLVGISSGGTAAWEFASRRPDLFAAIAPLSSTGGDHVQLERLVGTAVSAFHSTGDGPEGDRRTVEWLKSHGGCAQLTEIVGKVHDSWTLAFNKHGLLDWLLARRKGEACPIDTSKWPDKSTIASLAHSLPGAVTLLLIVAAVVVALRPPPRLQRLLKRTP
jgi:predicted esterase